MAVGQRVHPWVIELNTNVVGSGLAQGECEGLCGSDITQYLKVVVDVGVSKSTNPEASESFHKINILDEYLAISSAVVKGNLFLGEGGPTGGVTIMPVASVDVLAPGVSDPDESVCDCAGCVLESVGAQDGIGVASREADQV